MGFSPPGPATSARACIARPGPADFRFVEVARWSSPLMFSRTLQTPEFRSASQSMDFRSHPALYEVIRE